MSAALIGALLTASALAMVSAFLGAFIASSMSISSRFHPGLLRRWLRRLALVAMMVAAGGLLGAVVTLALPSFTSRAAVWLIASAAFGLGYRFASRRRMLRALDSGIAVGLH